MFQWEPLQEILCVLLPSANPSLTWPSLLVPQVVLVPRMYIRTCRSLHIRTHTYRKVWVHMETSNPNVIPQKLFFFPSGLETPFSKSESHVSQCPYSFTELTNPIGYKSYHLHNRGPPSHALLNHSPTLTSIHHSNWKPWASKPSPHPTPRDILLTTLRSVPHAACSYVWMPFSPCLGSDSSSMGCPYTHTLALLCSTKWL